MIVITGANGTLGRQVVGRLLDVVPAERVAVSVREPGAAADLAARGVRVRRGDFAAPESLVTAFEGAEQVLVVSAAASGDAAVRMNAAAIAAAVAAGARRVLYTSHMGAGPASAFAPMPTHAASEAALQATGVAFTALRNGFYTSTVPRLLGDAVRTGELLAPEDGPVSWTAHADLAEVAVLALTRDDADLDGVTPALTGSEALDLEGVAAVVSELTGRTVVRRVVSEEQYREAMVAGGVPTAAADLLLGLFRASRVGEFAAVDPTLARLLGRAPTSVRDVLAPALAPATGRA